MIDQQIIDAVAGPPDPDGWRPVNGSSSLRFDPNGRLFDGTEPALNGQIAHVYGLADNPTDSPEPTTNAQWAAFYAGLGWRIFPVWPMRDGRCGCGRPDCKHPGKHPVGQRGFAPRGVHNATNDTAIIASWWAKIPDANIGVATGAASGIYVVDIDPDDGGAVSWGDLVAEHGQPDTVEAESGGGGNHYYFHHVDGLRNTSGRLGRGIDTRGDGGYIILPPSNHYSGGRYEWELSSLPGQQPLAELPTWILDQLNQAEQQATPQTAVSFDAAPTDKPDLSQFPISELIRAAIVNEPAAAGSDRSAIDQSVISGLVRAGATDTHIKAVFDHYPIGTAGKYSEKGKHSEKYLALSIANARAYVNKPKTAINGAGGATPQRDYLTYPADDGGILDAFLDIYGDGWLYTNLGGWYRWAGTHWAMQKTDAAIKRVVMRLMVDMNTAAKQARKELKTAVETNPAAKEKSDAAKAMIRATRRSAARVNSVAVMAAAVLDQPQDTLDAIGKLNLQNGTLDLETGDLTQHDAGDYLTYCLPYEYNPAANCPNWLHVLRGIANSLGGETVDFLQEFAGYCLTPDTSHELAVWLHGQPGGGKSTFLAGLQTMLGPKSGLLGLADIERNTFALANLPGKTMVVSTEQPSMYLASGHILNAIISGEPVMVNRKFRDAVEVQPVAKLAWAMNELPRISDANNGLFRRVKVVSFAPIAPSDRRPELKAGLAREGAGILNWALRGLERLTQRGYFIVPQVVEDATAEFQSENDVMGMFVKECCIADPDAKVQSSLFYFEYKEWAKDNGYNPLNEANARKEWRRLGLTKTRITGRSYWKGVGLLERDMRDLEKDDGKGEGEK